MPKTVELHTSAGVIRLELDDAKAPASVGNFLDPWLMGRHLNLSPFVIIVSLTFWASIWGVPGAILAIPMTSMLMIVLSQFPETRFLAVMISETGEPDGPLGAGARRK